MKSHEEIQDKVISILKLIVPEEFETAIELEMSLINDLSIDSIKVAELSILLEDGFGCPVFIPDLLVEYRDPYEITVNALVDFVKKQLQE